MAGEEAGGRRVWIRPPRRFLDDLVAKGSVAVDGVSLTVAEIVRDRFSVALVPATLADTTLAALEEGRRVNLESDVVGLSRPPLVRPRRRGAGRRRRRAAVGRAPGGPGRLSTRPSPRSPPAAPCVVWDPDLEGEGDVVFAGAGMRPQAFMFLLTQACGHTTIPCAGEVLDRLEIPPMPGARRPPRHRVPCAGRPGRGNRRPACRPQERAATVRGLADPATRPGDFLQPGHVFPLRAPGRAASRAGRAHRGRRRAVSGPPAWPRWRPCARSWGPDGRMAGEADLERFALRWGLPMVAVRGPTLAL